MDQNIEGSIKHLAALIKGIKISMVTTVDHDGQLQSRPMATQEASFDGQLYFFIRKSGHASSEINADQHVNCAYSDSERKLYVSVSGEAVVLRDMEKMQELWNPVYLTWFPRGLEDKDLALLWITVTSAEYWESDNSFVAQALGFARAVLTGKKYSSTEHEKISLQ